MRMTIYPSRVSSGVLGMHSITELHRWEPRTGHTPQHARWFIPAYRADSANRGAG